MSEFKLQRSTAFFKPHSADSKLDVQIPIATQDLGGGNILQLFEDGSEKSVCVDDGFWWAKLKSSYTSFEVITVEGPDKAYPPCYEWGRSVSDLADEYDFICRVPEPIAPLRDTVFEQLTTVSRSGLDMPSCKPQTIAEYLACCSPALDGQDPKDLLPHVEAWLATRRT